MKKMSETELNYHGKRYYDLWVATFGLRNAVKVAWRLRKRLLDEENRRKKLDGKTLKGEQNEDVNTETDTEGGEDKP